MKLAYLVVEGENIRSISDILYNYKTNKEGDKPHIYTSENVVVIMREEYYLRISSTLMSVIILEFIDNNKVKIELTVSGAKEGPSMSSWGSENNQRRNIANEIISICNKNKWKLIKVEPESLKGSRVKSSINKIKNVMKSTLKIDDK